METWRVVCIKDRYQESLSLPHVREFDMTGRAMTGWVIVEPEGYRDEVELEEWIQAGLDFAATLPQK